MNVVDSAELSRLRISREPRPDPPGGRRSRLLIPGIAVGVLALLAMAFALVTRDRPLDVQVGAATVRGGGAGGGGLTANGYVVARTKASVSSKVPGRLQSLAYEEGDLVPEGAVIARLEAAEYQAAARLATAELRGVEAAHHEVQASFAQAERDLERAQSLAASSLIAPNQLEDAQTAARVAEIRVQAAEARLAAAVQSVAIAEANLENTLVRAPFSGTVLRKDAEVGEVVAPSVGGGLTRGAVVTIADLSTLEVEVDVNEAYIGGIELAQPAEIVLDAYPSVRFPGRVRQVLPTADRQKATVLVRVGIDSADPRILPEMGARVVFLEDAAAGDSARTAPPRVFAPAAAVRIEGGETVVYIVLDGRAQRRVVDGGPVSGGEREIRSGLSGGERLVLDPPAELDDGAPVRVVDDNGNREEG
jgi:RND family efflux transporter MFP subunit